MRYIVLDVDQRPGVGGLGKRIRHDQGNRLAGVVNLIVLERQIALSVRTKVAPGLGRRVHARHVAMSEYRKDARRLFGGSGVDRHGPAIGDRAVDDRRMHGTFDRNIGRVAGAAGDLQPTVGARDRLSDGVHARAPAICNARRATRCASSILKALWASGRASTNDKAIADLERINLVQRRSPQRRLGIGEPPGLVRDAAQGQARRTYAPPVDRDGGRGRHERELVRLAVADLEIMRGAPVGAGRHFDGDDQIASIEDDCRVPASRRAGDGNR